MANIVWTSELPFTGKVSRNFDNARTEYAWFIAQDADHVSINHLHTIADTAYDLAVIIIPKKLDNFNFTQVIQNLRRIATKYAFMQEGPSWYFQDLPLHQQMGFYSIMLNSDFALAHNDSDLNYYRGLFEDKPAYINPTLMIQDTITDLPTDLDSRKDIIVGGNLVRWYGGFNSLIIADSLRDSIDDDQKPEIYFPSMGRMHEDERKLSNIKHLPYLTWKGWMERLNKFKYAIHLNPNSIGGTFSLNCAYLGIPCIGNYNSNTQRHCFPALSIQPDDLSKARKLAHKLASDKAFYNQVSQSAKHLYNELYREEVYKQKWSDIIRQQLP